ncbi:DUF998 domain-containing protein [Micromonospora sp. HM5-17]|jgi:hypothetical protein|uniref:DUF998 domain-containing protein n=1 Tax=Micromonospora sp. HM5-17 TaxID=2487710 RepID=UPI000F49925C|nr:DUF998 domain-containing protein [Micromonospora sp. HM5-17]ROT33279.1 DUF998 domain-containing protein [Micromonospora sp. HM5-17]
MPAVPWWGVLSSVAAPVLLATGWTLAAVRRPDGYDPVADTISVLASFGMVDRLILITCLAGLGVAHLVTALGLRVVPLVARAVYGLGGVATIVVASVPKVDSATPPAHGISAVVGFVALGLWPAVALLPRARRQSGGTGRSGPVVPRDRPWVLRPPAALAATGVMLGSGLWLALQLPDGATAGLAEGVTSGTEGLWPLTVVLVSRRWSRHRRRAVPDAGRDTP